MAASTNTADTGNKLLTWILAGVGSLLVYSAYKNRSPLDVLRGVMGDPIDAKNTPTGLTSGNLDREAANVGSIPRLRLLANREIRPTLTNIPGGGQLDIDAANSYKRVVASLGWTPRNVGSIRSYAFQAAGNAANPGRFADPDKSLHVVGLAIDIHSGDANKPDLIAAMTKEGWHRYDPVGESWHWSYGVVG